MRARCWGCQGISHVHMECGPGPKQGAMVAPKSAEAYRWATWIRHLHYKCRLELRAACVLEHGKTTKDLSRLSDMM
eukprot:scaffold87678_cov20-Tisochrysis_lutea.AAC.2